MAVAADLVDRLDVLGCGRAAWIGRAAASAAAASCCSRYVGSAGAPCLRRETNNVALCTIPPHRLSGGLTEEDFIGDAVREPLCTCLASLCASLDALHAAHPAAVGQLAGNSGEFGAALAALKVSAAQRSAAPGTHAGAQHVQGAPWRSSTDRTHVRTPTTRRQRAPSEQQAQGALMRHSTGWPARWSPSQQQAAAAAARGRSAQRLW